ncbi:type I-D CRISPR-associated helicase Cas3' [Gloeobacter morelensis]|uniref:type I-D CRISPR-associated helicase Cas3' n=1 Tax=Gloeobacter morelensis TaxID=2907343 RepID=UPI001E422A7C|nr:type I-D CRISPR-associated helicase Cas3' [Gloeobacter morelensis]UFP97271.1 type I-D CRISPR-associated helicase Cas3' [Gloeobacter morelensis MG652769]
MHIHLPPLHSRLSDPAATFGFSWHQEATWEALADPEVDVVINTAFTGDGKSLAAYRPYLATGGVVGLYPTNSLVADQQRQMQSYGPQVEVNRLTGPELERWARREKASRGEVLLDVAQGGFLLTNPDLFYYLHQGNYLVEYLRRRQIRGLGGYDPTLLWAQVDRAFERALVLDEFHVLGVPQQLGILNTLLLLQAACPAAGRKIILLSATPEPRFLGHLQRAGFRCRVIDPAAQGGYKSGATPGLGWRQILQPSTLRLVNCERAEDWLRENLDSITDWFRAHPGSKGAVILTSLIAVHRLFPLLKKALAPLGLTVAQNTRLIKDGLDADLVIGTSTLDVGIDFKINFLIFDSPDGATAIQRLGRLGRHPGFEHYEAVVLLPQYVIERIGLYVREGQSVERPAFARLLRICHRQPNDFAGYFDRWGPLQALAIGRQLRHPELAGALDAEHADYLDRCEAVYRQPIAEINNQVRAWGTEWRELGAKGSSPIVKEATSFRSTGSLQCALYTPSKGSIDMYDLPGILSNMLVRPIAPPSKNAPSAAKQALLHLELIAYREKRAKWWLYLQSEQIESLVGKLTVLRGLEIWYPNCDGGDYTAELSRALRPKPMVAFVLEGRQSELRSRLNLSAFFKLYPLCYKYFHEEPGFCVALEQDALALDAHFHPGWQAAELRRVFGSNGARKVPEAEIEEDAEFLRGWAPG